MNVLFLLTRWVSFAGLVLLGGLVFLVRCWPAGRSDARARRLVWAGWGAAVAGAVFGLLLEGPYAAGTGAADVLSPSLLSVTVGTTYGRLLCARLVLLGGLLLLVRRLLQGHGTAPDRPGELEEDLSVIAGLAVLATYGGVGHAAAGSQTTLALLSDSAHLAAVATWVGGLVLLAACLLPSRRAAEIAVALPRFSQLAQAAVVVLIVTGTYQGWREVGSLPALAFTHYGQLLIAKIAAFVVLVGLGNLGRIAVRRRYLIPVAHALSTQDTVERSPSEEDRLLRRLRISVGLEVSIAAGVLALAAALVSTPPARSTYAEAYRASLLPVSDGSAQLAPAPARHGVNTVRPDAVGPTAFADPDPASHAHVRAPIALLVGPPR